MPLHFTALPHLLIRLLRSMILACFSHSVQKCLQKLESCEGQTQQHAYVGFRLSTLFSYKYPELVCSTASGIVPPRAWCQINNAEAGLSPVWPDHVYRAAQVPDFPPAPPPQLTLSLSLSLSFSLSLSLSFSFFLFFCGSWTKKTNKKNPEATTYKHTSTESLSLCREDLMSLCSFYWEPQRENKHRSRSEGESRLRGRGVHLNASRPECISHLVNRQTCLTTLLFYCYVIN